MGVPIPRSARLPQDQAWLTSSKVRGGTRSYRLQPDKAASRLCDKLVVVTPWLLRKIAYRINPGRRPCDIQYSWEDFPTFRNGDTMQTTKEKSATRRRRTGRLALLRHGFRPFFLFGSAYAAFAMSFWIVTLRNGTQIPGLFQGVGWHSHEMVLGYLAAIIAGFILTA